LKIHQEQCQTYLNRRGSVVTIGTNESDSSPSLVDSDDYVVVDEDKEPNFFLSKLTFALLFNNCFVDAPVKPQPIHLPGQTNGHLFSPPATSQRESFSSDVFFPGTPLLSPTLLPGQQQTPLPQLPFTPDQQNLQLDLLARLASTLNGGTKFPFGDNHQLPPVIPQTTSSSLNTLTRQNDMLFSSATSTASTNNNNYKESLNNLLMEQQLLQNLQKLQQLLHPTTPTIPLQSPPSLLRGLLNLPLPSQANPAPSIPPVQPPMDLLAQLQMGSNLLQSVLPPPPPVAPANNNLSASLAAALSDLARQGAQQPPALSQMFMN
jgi:hypothetical protein